MISHNTFYQPISWRSMVFGRNAVRVLLLGLCVLSTLVLPSYVHASSFSDMLSSLTPSTASSWKGNDEDSAFPDKPPVPERKPAWITQRAQVSSEQLLDADGHWNVVEQGREYDPAQAHLNARKKVDTARRKKMKSLSPHFKPDAKSGQDGKLRVLQIEPDDGVDYDIVENDEDNRDVSLFQKVFPTFKSAPSEAVPSEPVSPEPVSTAFNPAPVVAFEVDVLDVVVSEKSGIIVPKVKPNRWGNTAPVSVGQQVKTAGVMLVRSDSKVRMIDGVAIPPVMPARKRVVQAYVPSASSASSVPSYDTMGLSDADLLIETSTGGLMDGVVIPKRKPTKARPLSKKPEFKLALTDMVGISSVNVDEPFVSDVPVPSIKPKVTRKVLENGSASKRVVFVKNLRSGMHPDKTRVVIEVSDVTEYKVTVDDLRNVLRVKLMNTRWDISPQDKLKGSTLLGTYIARQQKDGSVLLEVRLKDKARIVGTMVLRPNISSSHRIVVDLKAL